MVKKLSKETSPSPKVKPSHEVDISLSPSAKKQKKQLVTTEDPDYIPEATEELDCEAVESIKVDDEVDEADYFIKVIKCVPKRLCNIVGTLKSKHKEAVEEIGFGGLLHLNLLKFPKNILDWMLEAFKPASFMFELPNDKFLMSKDDVYDCFQLPRGPNELNLLPTGRSSESSQRDAVDLKNKWRTHFGVSKAADGINFGPVCDRLKALIEANDAGDEFKQLFVLLSMGTFLAPTSNNKIDFKLLGCVEDVRRIKTFDWCSYVFNQLCTACKERLSQKRAITGCLLILYISYFHRFDFQGQQMPSTLPLIQHWDYQKLVNRATAELETGSLGNAPRSKVEYPVCKKSSRRPALDQWKGESAEKAFGAPRRSPVKRSSGKRSPVKKYMQLELPAGVEDDEELEANAVDDVHLLYLKIKRLSEVFCSSYGVLTSELKKLLDERASATSTADDSQGSVEMTPTQAFFSNPILHKYVDEVIKIVNYMKEASRKVPSFEQLSQIYEKDKEGDDMDNRPLKEFMTRHVAHVSSPEKGNDTICSLGEDAGEKGKDFVTFHVTPVQNEQEQNAEDIVSKVLAQMGEGDAMNDEGEDVGRIEKGIVEEELQGVSEKQKEDGTKKGKEKEYASEKEKEYAAEKEREHVVEKEIMTKGKKKDVAGKAKHTLRKEKGKATEEVKKGEGEKGNQDVGEIRNINVVHYIPTSTASYHPYLLHSTEPSSCMVVVPENMGCSIACGEPNPDQLVVSELIRDHLDLFAPVCSLRKDVIDYCFTFDHTFPEL